uniref:acylglycerol kinase, mitochondrial n=1 Tax=Panthera onca TaxID=9690 RepID=UPI00295394B5|nr:acylglycerol kinase, mitochondrial [Panthera onca]
MTVFFKTLRNHWKKTTAGICLLTWGSHWLYGKHCDNLLRRAACQEAQVFGNQLIPPNAQVKKATVFLNPAACKGKARTLFEKNAAPILHLSGMDVTVVKTDYEGQAKKLLELLENTDVIIVAGGDGTLQEVITGVLQRADEASFSKIPIGFIPLGQTSSLSHTLFAESGNKVQHITDATLAIVKGETIPLDVLQIKGEKEKPVFAVTGLRWGSFRDAGVKVSKTLKNTDTGSGALHTEQRLQPSKEDFMNICIEPDTVSKGDFITIGSKKVRDPRLRAAGTECLQASQCTLLLPEGTGGSFSIDSEEYEAMPVEVKLLPRKLQFFCDPRKREQLLPRSAQ